MLHKNIPLGDIHYIHNWEVADSAARLSLVLTAADRGKLCWQLDTNQFFFLTNHVGPSWTDTTGIEGVQGVGVTSILRTSGTGAPGATDTYTITYTNSTTSTFTITNGANGANGIAGADGADGIAGQGIPIGGTTGQVLRKLDNTDYNAEWVDPAIGGRELLSAARTYYVATTGSNSNNGLAVGTPFLTIQKAVDVICATLDTGSHQVTIQVADGTYSAGAKLGKIIGSLSPIIKGNTATPANVHINEANATSSCFTTLQTQGNNVTFVAPGVVWIVQDMKLTATRAGIEVYGIGNIIFTDNLLFGVCAFHMLASTSGQIIIRSSYAIAGNATYHMLSQQQGAIIGSNALTCTLQANIVVTSFAWCIRISAIVMANTTYTLGSFTLTGKRYDITENSIIATNSGNVNLFPGSAAGTTATGGQYT